MSRPRAGFSLVELLVIVFVNAALAVHLLITIHKVREASVRPARAENRLAPRRAVAVPRHGPVLTAAARRGDRRID